MTTLFMTIPPESVRVARDDNAHHPPERARPSVWHYCAVPTDPKSAPEPALGAAQRRFHAVLALLFAASGCAALIYEVVWFQLLTFSIGASAISLGVLLATFLGGLCIGSYAAARVVIRRQPLRVYAALEVGIGVLGIAALYVIPLLGGAYTAWAGTGATSLALRLGVAAACLLPATTLLGATLPMVARSRELAAPDGIARIGFLYAANTGGAVAGAVLAGFYLLRAHDVQTATFAAAALNLAVAAAAATLARTHAGSARTAVANPATGAQPDSRNRP
jgi:spermidine synthase